MRYKWIHALLALIISGCLLSGCAASGVSAPANTSSQVAVASSSGSKQASTLLMTEELFTDRDKEIGFEESESVHVTLTGDSASVEGAGVEVSGATITIREAGVYLISGSLTNGQVIIDATDADKIQLVLDGVNIHCDTSAALYVRQADKVVVTLRDGSQNTLSNQSEFVAVDDNSIDAVLFSKDDLTLNGDGALSITAAYGHGIVSKDDLTVTGGSYAITAAEHGITGKDCVKISDGSFVITSGKDAIHSENKDDATLGYVYIGGGSYQLKAQGDGISAQTALQVDSGVFTLEAGDGNGATLAADASAKGMKAGTDLLVRGGTFTLDTADDGMHANGNVTIDGGSFSILTGDDGMHADLALTVNDGIIEIGKSYEGLEGQTVDLIGGAISIVSSDDGVNAAGGQDGSGMAGGRPGQEQFGANANCYIYLSGGKLTVDAGGDGIDSNGSLTISGGETYVSGPEGGGNSALDCDGTITTTGGVLIAAGSSGMARGFGSDSTQGAILYNLSSSQTGEITLTSADGSVLAQFTPVRQYTSVAVSAPGMKLGETYTLTAGSGTQQITLETITYSNGGGVGGGRGGMGGGGRGGMGGGGRGGMRPSGTTPPNGEALPDGAAPPALPSDTMPQEQPTDPV